jgi:hypothetical protein
MGKFLAVCSVLLCFVPFIHAQKTRFGQVPKAIGSPVKAHIYASHIRNMCDEDYVVSHPIRCGRALVADVALGGEKIELTGAVEVEGHNLSVLTPGEYKAELTEDIESRDRMAVHREYNLTMPDGTVWHGVVTGVSE